MDKYNDEEIPPPPDHIPPPPPQDPPPPPPPTKMENGPSSQVSLAHRQSIAVDSKTDSVSTVYVRVAIPEQHLQKCLCFHLDKTVWTAKQQVLATLSKELDDGNNYGFYLPPENGKAGKFLDEERPLRDYPLRGAIAYLEFKYKRRVYRQLKLDKMQIRKLHSKANLKNFMHFVKTLSVGKVSKMLDKGLDPNYHDESTGETPLTVAAVVENSDKLIMTLVNGGAHVDYRSTDGLTPLHKAARTANYKSLKIFLDLGTSPNLKDGKGLTPLYHTMFSNSNADCVQLLLHERSNINVADDQGWREIHQACRYGKIQHLEHLLYYGVDMNVQNTAGNTALHVCALYNQESCARVLLFRGANKEIKNYASQSPFQVAIVADNFELAEMIRNHTKLNVVPFREEPKYSIRRRSVSSYLPVYRTWSDTHLPQFKPEQSTTTGSLRSLPAFATFSFPKSSTSHIAVANQTDYDDVVRYAAPSQIVINNVMNHEKVQQCTPGRVFIATKNYTAQETGELTLSKGDIVEVLSIGKHNYWEGRVQNTIGWFPSYCVEEVKLRDKKTQGSEKLVANQDLKRRSCPLSARSSTSRLETKTVVLQKKTGFGFVLRGAKTKNPSLNFQPTAEFPALQYLDSVDENGVAHQAGLRAGDFVLEINGIDVRYATHCEVVDLVKKSNDTLLLKVTTVIPQTSNVWMEVKESKGSVKKSRAPNPPTRSADTRLGTTQNIGPDEIAALEELDNAIKDYSSVGDISTWTEGCVASIRSRPTSKRLSHAEIKEMFERQGGVSRSNGNDVTFDPQKPKVLIPSGVKAATLKRHSLYFGKLDKSQNFRSSSTPNLTMMSQDLYRYKNVSPSGSVTSDSGSSNRSEISRLVSTYSVSEEAPVDDYRRFSVQSDSRSTPPSSSTPGGPPPSSFTYPDASPGVKTANLKYNRSKSLSNLEKANESAAPTQKFPSSFNPDNPAKFNMLPPAVSQQGIRTKLKQHQRNSSLSERSSNPMPARQSIHLLPEPDYMDFETVNQTKDQYSPRQQSANVPQKSLAVTNGVNETVIKNKTDVTTAIKSSPTDNNEQIVQPGSTNSVVMATRPGSTDSVVMATRLGSTDSVVMATRPGSTDSVVVATEQKGESSSALQMALAAKEKSLKQSSKKELVGDVDPSMALKIAVERRRLEIESADYKGDNLDEKVERYKHDRWKTSSVSKTTEIKTDAVTTSVRVSTKVTKTTQSGNLQTSPTPQTEVNHKDKTPAKKVFIIEADKANKNDDLARKTALQNARIKANIQRRHSGHGKEDFRSVIAKRAAEIEAKMRAKEIDCDLPSFIPPPPAMDAEFTDDRSLDYPLPPPPEEFSTDNLTADNQGPSTQYSNHDIPGNSTHITEDSNNRQNKQRQARPETDSDEQRPSLNSIIKKFETTHNGTDAFKKTNNNSIQPYASSDGHPEVVLPPPVLFDDVKDVSFVHQHERSFDNVSTVSSVSTLSSLSSLSARSADITDPQATIREDDEHPTDRIQHSPYATTDDSFHLSTTLPPTEFSDSTSSPTSREANGRVVHDSHQKLNSGIGMKNEGKSRHVKSVNDWSVGEVGDWLESIHMTEYKETFQENEINGEHLSALTKDDYIELGITRIGHRITIDRARKKLLHLPYKGMFL